MAGWPPRKNAAFTWFFIIRDADGDPVAGATALDVEFSIDGGVFADVGGAEVDEGEGLYSCPITTAEMNGDAIALICKTSTAGAKTAAQVIYTSTRQLDDLAFPAVSGRSFEVETDGMVHGDLKEWLGVAPLALIAQRVAANAAVVGDKTGYTLTVADQDAIVDKVWDELVSGHIAAGSIGNLVERLDLIATGGVGGLTDARAVNLDNLDASISSRLAPTVAARTLDIAATGEAGIDFNNILGTLAAADIAADAIGASQLATDAVNEIRDAILNIVTGTADAGSSATVIRDAERTESTVDYWQHGVVEMTSGPNVGQMRRITAFAPATDDVTVAPAFKSVVAAGDTYRIVHVVADSLRPITEGNEDVGVEADGHVHGDLKEWLGVAPLALIAQRVAANAAVVGDKTGYALTVADKDDISDRVWDEAVAGHIAAGSVGNLVERLDIVAAGGSGGLTNARAVLLDNLDALITSRAIAGDAMSLTAAAINLIWDELTAEARTAGSYGQLFKDDIDATISSRAAPGAAMDLVTDALDALAVEAGGAAEMADKFLGRNIAGGSDGGRDVTSAFRALRNRWTISGGTLTVFQEDDTTSAWTAVVTTAVGDPITEVNPA